MNAERKLIKRLLAGELVALGDAVPEEDGPRVRAAVICELLSGQHGQLPPKGLHIQGAFIDGDVDLRYMEWTGALNLTICNIAGQLNLLQTRVRGSISLKDSRVRRVYAMGARVDGQMYLNGDLIIKEGIHAVGITITGGLHLSGARIEANATEAKAKAVDLYRAQVGDVFIKEAKILGGLYAAGIVVDRNLRLAGSTIWSRHLLGWEDQRRYKRSLDLTAARVAGAIYFDSEGEGPAILHGQASLNAASCQTLQLTRTIFEGRDLQITGLTFDRLTTIAPGDFLQLVDDTAELSTQPYTHLSSYCRTVGDEETATKAMIHLKRRVSKHGKNPASRLGAIAFGALIGYGYRPRRALAWLLATAVAYAALLQHVGFVRNDKHDEPGSSLRYAIALDSLLPFASMHIADKWMLSPESFADWVVFGGLMLVRLFAWTLVALSLASVSGVVRKST